MAIQSRRGNLVDFDPIKMLPGEWAVTLDSKYIYMCFSAGDVRRMATYEEMVENVNSATDDVQAMFTAEVREAIRQAAVATETAEGKIGELQEALDSIGDATDRADAAAEAAESYVMGDISDKTVTFSESVSEDNIATGESLATLFGKIKKRFSDLVESLKGLSDTKVDKADGKGLSTNDYSDEEKKKLSEALSVIESMPIIQTGVVTITTTAADTPTGKAITFNPAFPGVPKVFPSPISSVPGTTMKGCSAYNITETGCIIRVTRGNAGTIDTTIDWMAIYLPE